MLSPVLPTIHCTDEMKILVHGEKHNMMRLKSKLLSLNSDKATKTKIFSPANTEELRIPFKMDKTAKVVGRLAQTPPPKASDDERLITGVLVQNDFKMSLMAPEDLREYAGLTTTTITCKQRLTLSAAGVDLIRWALEGTFGSIEELGPKRKPLSNGVTGMNGNSSGNEGQVIDEDMDQSSYPTAYLVMGCVIVRHENKGEVTVEWEGNMLNDGIADAVLAVLFTVESSPAAVKRKHFLVTQGFAKFHRIFERPPRSAFSHGTQSPFEHNTRRTAFKTLHVP